MYKTKLELKDKKSNKNKSKNKIGKYIKIFLVIFITLTIIIALLAGPIAHAINGESFNDVGKHTDYGYPFYNIYLFFDYVI